MIFLFLGTVERWWVTCKGEITSRVSLEENEIHAVAGIDRPLIQYSTYRWGWGRECLIFLFLVILFEMAHRTVWPPLLNAVQMWNGDGKTISADGYSAISQLALVSRFQSLLIGYLFFFILLFYYSLVCISIGDRNPLPFIEFFLPSKEKC